MNNQPIKSFTAVTYENQTYHFIITSDNKIYCCEFRLEYGADIIEIKPNFVLRDKNSQTIYSLKDYLREIQQNHEKPDEKRLIFSSSDKEKQQNLIKNYIIEPQVLEYLIENKMLMYSHDMAILYGLDPKHAYDGYFQTRSFKNKRHKEKTKVLTNQKKGIFS